MNLPLYTPLPLSKHTRIPKPGSLSHASVLVSLIHSKPVTIFMLTFEDGHFSLYIAMESNESQQPMNQNQPQPNQTLPLRLKRKSILFYLSSILVLFLNLIRFQFHQNKL